MSKTKPIEGITLKHLAPYLAYGLKGMVNGIERELVGHSYTSLELARKNGGTTMCKYDQFQPLLRSLSDLTKEIEVNGKRFVPNEWLNENMPNTPNFRYMLNASHHFDLSETIIEWCVMNKLIEWHFDVFDLRSKNLCIYFDEFKNGLIDRGLAVNINDIQK